MDTEENKETGTTRPVALREDGFTFLSRKELDEYRGEKMLAEWNDGAYV